MVNFAMSGISPEQQAKARQVGELVEVRFEKHRAGGTFTIVFVPRRQGVDTGPLVDQFVESMATQLYSFFGIGGKIVEME